MAINTKLADIIRTKLKVIESCKLNWRLAEIEGSDLYARPTISLQKGITDGMPFIIAEFKRESPAKGPLKVEASVTEIVSAYETAGAKAISVLTEEDFFKGSPLDLLAARKATKLPLLRKDFILDQYQISESKALGADLILLIAAILKPDQLNAYSRFAQSLGLEVLLEIHEPDELDEIDLTTINFLGVNNRNLETFHTDFQHSIKIINQLPTGLVRISESGISEPEIVSQLFQQSYQGFLIGEHFMRHSSPGKALQELRTKVLGLIQN